MDRNKMLDRVAYIQKLPETSPGIHLHLGCGPHVLPGFINIDKYYIHPDVLPWDMFDIKYPEKTIDTIYSSHALEHLPIRHAKMALSNWFTTLKTKGRLFLAIPDLEEIMRILLDPNVDDNLKWNWYIYTLFGYQVDPNKYSGIVDLNLPVEAGQFHTCGFTKKSIEMELTRVGFTINELYTYDGWSTPSIWVEAVKI